MYKKSKYSLFYSFSMAFALVMAITETTCAQASDSIPVSITLRATTARQPVRSLDTISYYAEIQNLSDTTFSNITISRNGDANTTLIPGSFRSTPVALPISSVRVLEDQAASIQLSGVDLDGNVLDFNILQIPQNGTLGVIASASNTTATISFQPNADFSGTDQFVFFVTDEDGNRDTAAVDLQIQAVNDAPGFQIGMNIVLSATTEAQTFPNWATAISPGPADEQDQILSFVIEEIDNPNLFSVNPQIAADGTLTFTPATDAVGTATIRIRLQDNGGNENGGTDTSDIQEFTITLE